ncbi:MAG: CDP-diacylglycerol--glycerol-3-phosphate 3-phosphatidyltransferase [Egibacteraceae bacterium]
MTLPEPADPVQKRPEACHLPHPGTCPPATTSLRSWANLLTLLRIALVPVVAVLLLTDGRAARWWAFGVFLFAALTDSVDGWVARRSGVTRWGQLADPAADKALIIAALAALAASGELPWLAVVVIAAREVWVSLQRWRFARRGRVMPASTLGKAKTVSQIVLVTLYLLPGIPWRIRAVGLVVAIALTLYSGAEYAFRGERLSRAG